MKILRYIKGCRKGEKAHRLELEAMKDPFLAESLEGYDIVEGNHSENIQFLRSYFGSSRKHQKRIQKVRWHHFSIWYVYAIILMCVIIGGYFIAHIPIKTSPKQENIAIDSINSDSIKHKLKLEAHE